MLLFPFAVFLFCCSTVLSGHCNVSFSFLGILGVMKLHHFALHSTFKNPLEPLQAKSPSVFYGKLEDPLLRGWHFSAGAGNSYTLNVWSRGKQLVLFSRESSCFPRRSRVTSFPRDQTLSALLYI